jgi:hypothetical protein
MPHKFNFPPPGLYAPIAGYVVTAALPERNDEFEYRIKHPNEAHERIARESELRRV